MWIEPIMKSSSEVIRAPLLVLLLAVCGAAAVHAQQSSTASSSAPMPKIVVPFTSYDFGEITKGEVISQVFVVRNQGTADLMIRDFTADCTCEVVSADRTIPPGQEGRATIEVNTILLTGQILKRATLRTNDPQQPAIMLSLSAIVLANPDGTALSGMTPRDGKHIGPVFIAPYDRWKFTASQTITARKEFTVTVERESLQIRSVEGAEPNFKATLVTVKPGKSYKILVEVLPRSEPGRYEVQLRVNTDNALIPWFPITLIIRPNS